MSQMFTFTDFNNLCPDDSACLETLKLRRYGDSTVCSRCGTKSSLTRIPNRSSYALSCGHHVSPLADTIFHKSSTSLKLWFYAIFLMAHSKAGISAKQLERELGVTYKTAWRMLMKIRSLMEETEPLEGVVEVDETYVRPRPYFKMGLRHNQREIPTQILMGMVERGGRARMFQIPVAGARVLQKLVVENIKPGSVIYSDGHPGYIKLARMGYRHDSVNHSISQWKHGETHTQTVEGLWSQIKRGLKGVYRHVSPKYIQQYANEFAWRYSHRNDNEPLFLSLLRLSSRPNKLIK